MLVGWQRELSTHPTLSGTPPKRGFVLAMRRLRIEVGLTSLPELTNSVFVYLLCFGKRKICLPM